MLNRNFLVGCGVGGGGPLSNQWRLRFPDAATYPLAYEIEMRGSSGGADQCNGGTPTSSGNLFATPAEAFDNNASTFHIATGADKWIAYQFMQPVSVAQISYSTMGTNSSYRVPTIVLEYYNGTAWVEVAQWTGLTWTTDPETKVLTV